MSAAELLVISLVKTAKISKCYERKISWAKKFLGFFKFGYQFTIKCDCKNNQICKNFQSQPKPSITHQIRVLKFQVVVNFVNIFIDKTFFFSICSNNRWTSDCLTKIWVNWWSCGWFHTLKIKSLSYYRTSQNFSEYSKVTFSCRFAAM